MLEGVNAALAAAQLSSGMLVVRSVAPEREVIVQTARELLNRADRPTAFICRTALYAECVAEAVEQMGLSLSGDLKIAVAQGGRHGPTRRPYAYVQSQIDMESYGRLLGRLLVQCANGRKPDPDHYEIPVTLEDSTPTTVSAHVSNGVELQAELSGPTSSWDSERKV
jgi:DNA-binding LacI/PurR family transcriptional regulator